MSKPYTKLTTHAYMRLIRLIRLSRQEARLTQTYGKSEKRRTIINEWVKARRWTQIISLKLKKPPSPKRRVNRYPGALAHPCASLKQYLANLKRRSGGCSWQSAHEIQSGKSLRSLYNLFKRRGEPIIDFICEV